MQSKRIADWERQVAKLEAQRAAAKQSLITSRRDLQEAREDRRALEDALGIAQGLAQQIQQQAHSQISSFVSRCLEAIFEEPYDFEIEFVRKRNKTEANLVFWKNGERIDPLTASGGGVIDATAFALRLACLTLSRPQPRKLLVLDEPYKFLSREYRPAMRALLESLAKELDFQFLIISHDPEFQVGKVIEL